MTESTEATTGTGGPADEGSTTVVERLLPTPATVDAATVIGDLRAAGHRLRPFDDDVVAFVTDLSRRLRRDPTCRRLPAAAALAFWIRPANLKRLRAGWQTSSSRDNQVIVAPRGVVFHLPPTNVDTLFVYSWLLSALAGNTNVVRISDGADLGAAETNGPGMTEQLLCVIADTLADHPVVAATTCFVRYGHEAETTAALSTGDLRVVWGGDETVQTVRGVPIDPLGSELSFADRFSMAVFRADAMVAADDAEHDEVVRRFYTDNYWFDQLGCSSARLVLWCGDEDSCRRAEARFETALRTRIAQEGYRAPTGAVMDKLARAATMAADGHARSVSWAAPELTVVHQPDDAPIVRDSPGGGLFTFRRIRELDELVDHVTRRDQTLSHHGFDRDELTALAERLNGVGIDRMVPVGRALEFDRFWDGWDLLERFTRRIVVRT